MKRTVKVTVVQRLSEGTIKETLGMMTSIIKRYRGSDIIVFPEMIVESSSAKVKERRKQVKAERLTRILKVEMQLKELSRRYNVDIVFGSMERLFNMVFNTGVLISGGRIRRYRKVHVHWIERFEGGKRFSVFDSACGKVGILVCFDAAFPESARVLALKGARIIFVIANAPIEFDDEYMRLRLRSMALDNQLFVVYCNKPGPSFSGHSAIFDPMGRPVHEAGTESGVFTREISLRDIDKWRMTERIFENRHPRLYRPISK